MIAWCSLPAASCRPVAAERPGLVVEDEHVVGQHVTQTVEDAAL